MDVEAFKSRPIKRDAGLSFQRSARGEGVGLTCGGDHHCLSIHHTAEAEMWDVAEFHAFPAVKQEMHKINSKILNKFFSFKLLVFFLLFPKKLLFSLMYLCLKMRKKKSPTTILRSLLTTIIIRPVFKPG